MQEAIAEAMRKAVPAIQRHLANIAAEELEKALSPGAPAPSGTARRSRPRVDLTRWVADRNARRVPNFVIQLTGLDTKKKIVARYGPDVPFDKGKPLPKPLK